MAKVLPPKPLEPSNYGLVNSKTLVNETERWISGFDQESIACRADVKLIDVCDTGVDVDIIEGDGPSSIGEYIPFGVSARVDCSTMGGMRVDWEQRAKDALEQCYSKAVETEFWEGRLAREAGNANRYLANGDAEDITPTSGTAVKVRYGLALLEGKLAELGCGGKGFIHVPRSIGSVLPLKDKDGDGVLTTALGNYVIAGDGYTGTGTDGAATTGSSVWLYATGPVSVRLDEPTVSADYPRQSINTSTNKVEVSAERMAAVTWDGCVHIGVLVDLSLDYA